MSRTSTRRVTVRGKDQPSRELIATSSPGRRAVTRSRRQLGWLGLVAVAVVAVLAYLPYLVCPGTTDTLVNFLILLLARHAGLVSVGQQAFVGLGAYLC